MISSKYFIVWCLFALGTVSCLPDCMTSNLTCPLKNEDFVLPPKYAETWERCRDLCNNNTKCTSFTFYGDNGSPFRNLCFLFDHYCKKDKMVDCQSCVYGYRCDYCSIGNLAYSINSENLISMLTSYSESSCRDTCEQTTNCSYYTVYTYEDELMPSTCILLSGSTEPVPCEYCRTGPKNCNFSTECKSNEAVIMTPSPRKHAIISTNGTQKVETMGCSTEANILLIGGGGTGGHVYSSSTYMYGGGGSGYINYTTVRIPFRTSFDILVGNGGYERYSRHNNYYDGKVTMFGQATTIIDENGALVLQAEGGQPGYDTAGGNGYSGGGSAGGKDGGTNGGDGQSSSHYKGGCGSGFNISTAQHLFNYYHLQAAKGNNGSTGTSSSSYGGGGGGVYFQPITRQVGMEIGGVQADIPTSYYYGQGGDGKGGRKSRGNKGAVLFEIREATGSLIATK